MTSQTLLIKQVNAGRHGDPFDVTRFRRVMLGTLAWMVGWRNRLPWGGPKRLVLLCPPVPEGNRGDQALLRAVVESLKARGYQRLELVQTSYHPIESIQRDQAIRIHCHLRHVFESPRCFREQLKFILFLFRARHVVLVGCDVLDEGYSPARSCGSLYAMYLASLAVRSTRIIGFSINDTSSAKLYQRFIALRQRHVALYARDAVTVQRLEDQGVKGVHLVGDLAFLLEPAAVDQLQDKELQKFITQNHGHLVGLNFTQGVMGSGQKRDTFFDHMVQACGLAAAQLNVRFVCIPHDDQGGIEYLQMFHDKLAAAFPGISYMVSPMPSAADLKGIAGQCEQVFTCRLHLAIATLGMGRPVTGFPYQGKFEGQLRHFGLDESNLVPPATLERSVEGLYQLLANRLARTSSLALQVQSALPDVLAMSRRNFEEL